MLGVKISSQAGIESSRCRSDAGTTTAPGAALFAAASRRYPPMATHLWRRWAPRSFTPSPALRVAREVRGTTLAHDALTLRRRLDSLLTGLDPGC